MGKKKQKVQFSQKKAIKEWMVLVGLFALSFGLRLVFLNQVKDSPLYLPVVPGTDQYNFYRIGMGIAQGDIIGHEVYTSPPLYGYFLGGLFSLLGRGFYPIRLFQILIGSLSCLLIYLIAKRLFNRYVAIVAGSISALYGIFLFYEVSFLGSFLVIFTLLASLYLVILSRRRYWLLIPSGIFLGLSILGRPNLLLVPPGVILWLLIWEGSKGKVALKNSVYFLMGLFIIIAPVTIRNYCLSRDFILITSHGGINFFIGNNPQADGTYKVPQQMGGTQKDALDFAERVAKQEMGRDIPLSQISNYWYKKGLNFILTQPGAYLKLLLRKISLFWHSYEIPLETNYYFARRFSSVLKLPLFTFFLISPLALLGIILTLKENKAEVRLILIVLLLIFISVVLFYVTSRYRLPCVPLAIILASFSIMRILSELRKRNLKWMLGYLPLLAILFLLTGSSLFKPGNFNFAISYYNLGNYFKRKGDLERAAQEYRRAIQSDPTMAVAHFDLGNVLAYEGKTAEAIHHYHRVISLDPSYTEAYINLGVLYLKTGQLEQSVQAFKSALTWDEKLPEIYVYLGDAYLKWGKVDSAIVAYSKSLNLNPKAGETLIKIGAAYAVRGLKERRARDLVIAKDYLHRALSLNPNQPKAKDLLTKIDLFLKKGLFK